MAGTSSWSNPALITCNNFILGILDSISDVIERPLVITATASTNAAVRSLSGASGLTTPQSRSLGPNSKARTVRAPSCSP